MVRQPLPSSLRPVRSPVPGRGMFIRSPEDEVSQGSKTSIRAAVADDDIDPTSTGEAASAAESTCPEAVQLREGLRAHTLKVEGVRPVDSADSRTISNDFFRAKVLETLRILREDHTTKFSGIPIKDLVDTRYHSTNTSCGSDENSHLATSTTVPQYCEIRTRGQDDQGVTHQIKCKNKKTTMIAKSKPTTDLTTDMPACACGAPGETSKTEATTGCSHRQEHKSTSQINNADLQEQQELNYSAVRKNSESGTQVEITSAVPTEEEPANRAVNSQEHSSRKPDSIGIDTEAATSDKVLVREDVEKSALSDTHSTQDPTEFETGLCEKSVQISHMDEPSQRSGNDTIDDRSHPEIEKILRATPRSSVEDDITSEVGRDLTLYLPSEVERRASMVTSIARQHSLSQHPCDKNMDVLQTGVQKVGECQPLCTLVSAPTRITAPRESDVYERIAVAVDKELLIAATSKHEVPSATHPVPLMVPAKSRRAVQSKLRVADVIQAIEKKSFKDTVAIPQSQHREWTLSRRHTPGKKPPHLPTAESSRYQSVVPDDARLYSRSAYAGTQVELHKKTDERGICTATEAGSLLIDSQKDAVSKYNTSSTTSCRRSRATTLLYTRNLTAVESRTQENSKSFITLSATSLTVSSAGDLIYPSRPCSFKRQEVEAPELMGDSVPAVIRSVTLGGAVVEAYSIGSTSGSLIKENNPEPVVLHGRSGSTNVEFTKTATSHKASGVDDRSQSIPDPQRDDRLTTVEKEVQFVQRRRQESPCSAIISRIFTASSSTRQGKQVIHRSTTERAEDLDEQSRNRLKKSEMREESAHRLQNDAAPGHSKQDNENSKTDLHKTAPVSADRMVAKYIVQSAEKQRLHDKSEVAEAQRSTVRVVEDPTRACRAEAVTVVAGVYYLPAQQTSCFNISREWAAKGHNIDIMLSTKKPGELDKKSPFLTSRYASLPDIRDHDHRNGRQQTTHTLEREGRGSKVEDNTNSGSYASMPLGSAGKRDWSRYPIHARSRSRSPTKTMSGTDGVSRKRWHEALAPYEDEDGRDPRASQRALSRRNRRAMAQDHARKSERLHGGVRIRTLLSYFLKD